MIRLELKDIELFIQRGAGWTLPKLTHLRLEDTVVNDAFTGDYTALLSPAAVPCLTHLTSITGPNDDEPLPVNRTTARAFASIAPQLVELGLGEWDPFLCTDDSPLWASCINLRTLRFGGPAYDTEGLASVLAHLPPASLTTLDLTLVDDHHSVCAAALHARDGFNNDFAGVKALNLLILPTQPAWELNMVAA